MLQYATELRIQNREWRIENNCVSTVQWKHGHVAWKRIQVFTLYLANTFLIPGNSTDSCPFGKNYDCLFPNIPCSHCDILLLPMFIYWEPFSLNRDTAWTIPWEYLLPSAFIIVGITTRLLCIASLKRILDKFQFMARLPVTAKTVLQVAGRMELFELGYRYKVWLIRSLQKARFQRNQNCNKRVGMKHDIWSFHKAI